MLRQLAVALSVLIVVILAVLAAVTILNVTDDDSSDEADGETVAGPATVDRAAIAVAVGPQGEPLVVECRLADDGRSPLLVTFENRTLDTIDVRAEVELTRVSGSSATAQAAVADLRPGERRSALPEPWQDPESVAECAVIAVQSGDHVALIDSD